MVLSFVSFRPCTALALSFFYIRSFRNFSPPNSMSQMCRLPFDAYTDRVRTWAKGKNGKLIRFTVHSICTNANLSMCVCVCVFLSFSAFPFLSFPSRPLPPFYDELQWILMLFVFRITGTKVKSNDTHMNSLTRQSIHFVQSERKRRRLYFPLVF